MLNCSHAPWSSLSSSCLQLYKDQDEWTRRSILYTAGSGKFSSDRTIVEYAKDIWHITPAKPPSSA
jgi:glucan phosphorylase